MLKKFLKPTTLTNQISLAVLLLRLGLAGLMIPHGYNKLQSFLAGVHDFPDPLHVSPMVSQGLTIFAEFFCSLLLIIGLFTRLASVVLIICMGVVALVIHGDDPLGDKEQALLYLTGFVAIFLTGPGKYSLDTRLFK
ncbi:DoxX family protein [Emticicia agri]|uniref:DoxX family protein n=1 Tax=Emticicia agri TaxID=2492393 RepID=A0A4Q5M3G0_9BACT|nr:DoxX family protein [Emticicia agri]RYU96916.1 DoxX family protein [Emticicia agri]